MWPGAILDNTAMQWAGFVLFLVFLFAFVSRWLDEFVTIEEAQKKIDVLKKAQEEPEDGSD